MNREKLDLQQQFKRGLEYFQEDSTVIKKKKGKISLKHFHLQNDFVQIKLVLA